MKVPGRQVELLPKFQIQHWQSKVDCVGGQNSAKIIGIRHGVFSGLIVLAQLASFNTWFVPSSTILPCSSRG